MNLRVDEQDLVLEAVQHLIYRIVVSSGQMGPNFGNRILHSFKSWRGQYRY